MTASMQPAIEPTVATLLPTYRCSAACSNCCFASNPGITHRMPQAQILRYVDAIAADFPSVRLVCVSGGEAFLLGRDLDEIIRKCHDLNLLTRVVTNGYWAKSKAHAVTRLEALKSAGLDELNFSTGDEHAAFVPVQRVVWGACASLEAGLPTVIMVECTARSRIRVEALGSHPSLRAASRVCRGKATLMLLQSPWMRHHDGPVPGRKDTLANRENLPAQPGCESVLKTVVVTPSERLGLCCGLPREDIDELNVDGVTPSTMRAEYAKASNDLIKIWLHLDGPARMLNEAAIRRPEISWENQYAHICDACRAVFSDSVVADTVRELARERRTELLLRFAEINAMSDRPRPRPTVFESGAIHPRRETPDVM